MPKDWDIKDLADPDVADLDVEIEKIVPQRTLRGHARPELMKQQIKEMNERLELMQKSIERLIEEREKSSR